MTESDFIYPYTGKAVSCYGTITKCAIYTDKYGNRELHAWVVAEDGTAGIIHMDTIYSYERNRNFDKHIA